MTSRNLLLTNQATGCHPPPLFTKQSLSPPIGKHADPMKSWFRSEDVLAVALGVLIVAMSLSALTGLNLLGWLVAVKEWTDPAKALAPSSQAFSNLTGYGALAATFVFMLVILSAGAVLLPRRERRSLRSPFCTFVRDGIRLLGSGAQLIHRGDAKQTAARRGMVARFDQRSGLPAGPGSRAIDWEHPAACRGLVQGSGQTGAIHQDGHRDLCARFLG